MEGKTTRAVVAIVVTQTIIHDGWGAVPWLPLDHPLQRCLSAAQAHKAAGCQKGLQQETIITSKLMSFSSFWLVDVQTNVDKYLNSMTITIGEAVYTNVADGSSHGLAGWKS